MQKTQRRVEQSLKDIEKFYAQGSESFERNPERRMAYGGMLEVQKRGTSPEMLRKARAFADPKVGYTRRELDRLIKDARHAEYALGFSHIIRLLSVPKGEARCRLEQLAIAGKWSRNRLDSEILKEFGQRRALAGRHAHTPDDAGEALVSIAKLCRRWKGLMQEIMPAGKPAFRLSPSLIKELRAVDRKMGALRSAVEK